MLEFQIKTKSYLFFSFILIYLLQLVGGLPGLIGVVAIMIVFKHVEELALIWIHRRPQRDCLVMDLKEMLVVVEIYNRRSVEEAVAKLEKMVSLFISFFLQIFFEFQTTLKKRKTQ